MYSLGLLKEYSSYLNFLVCFNDNNKGQKLCAQPLGDIQISVKNMFVLTQLDYITTL